MPAHSAPPTTEPDAIALAVSETARVRALRHPRLKLLLVNYEFPPVGGGGGRASYNIAKELVARGHDVHVLTSRHGTQPGYEMTDGLVIHRVLSWRKGILDCGVRGALTFVVSGWFRLHRLLAQHEFDLVHYFFSLPSGVLSFYSHGVRGLPYIVSLRGSDVPGYDETSRTLKFLHGLLSGANRRIWRRAKRVVALSGDFRALASKLAPDLPIDVIYNGVDPSRFAPAEEPRSRREPRLVSVSRLIDRKGLRYLFEALARPALRELGARLVLVGEGPEEAQLRAHVAELGIADRVRFAGYVPNEELRREYQRADLFVHPSLSEALGSVVLEAMSCGLPVVATETGGIPEMIRDGVNGLLVPPGDVDALAEAIRRLACDERQRQTMSEANLESIARHFTWAANAERYEQVYVLALADS